MMAQDKSVFIMIQKGLFSSYFVYEVFLGFQALRYKED